MRRVRIAILISIVLISGLVLAILWVNLRERSAPEEGEGLPRSSTEGADARLEKIRLVEDRHGRKTWELEARSIQQYQDPGIMMLEEVKVTFYTKEGRSFIISGDRGKIYQDSKNMELVGNVVVTSSDGYRLKTHSVLYQHSEKKVTTSDPVEIEGAEIRLAGRGMMMDMEAKIFKILNQAKTQWRGGKKG